MKQLIFVETPESVDKVGAELTTANSLVALSPQAEYAAERRNLAFSTTDVYASDSELIQLGLANFDRLTQFCNVLDEHVVRYFPQLKEIQLQPGFCSYILFKRIYDPVTLAVHSIRAVLLAEKPDRVFYFRTRHSAPFNEMLDFTDESLFDLVIPIVCEALDIPCEARDGGDWTLVKKRPFRSVFRFLARISRYQFRMAINRLHRAKHFGAKSAEYNVLDLDGALSRDMNAGSDIDAVLFTPVSLGCWGRRWPWQACWDDLLGYAPLRDLLVQDGIDFFLILETRLKHWLNREVARLYDIGAKARGLLRHKSHSTVLSIEMESPWRRAVAHGAQSVGRPVAVIQHGGFGLFRFPLAAYGDFAVSDYFLCYGPGVCRFIEREYPKVRSKPIPTGWAVLEKMMSQVELKENRHALCRQYGFRPECPIVFYVLGNMMGNTRYISLNTCSDSRFWHIQRAIVDVFRDFPDLQFVVKLHPSTSFPTTPLVQYISDFQFANVHVLSEPLLQVLSLADMFIIDAPATAILQMLTTGKRILVFNDFFNFDESALELLKKSVVFSNDLPEFLSLLHTHLEQRRFDPVRTDDGEFLRQYGTHLGDGQSIQRVVEALQKICYSR